MLLTTMPDPKKCGLRKPSWSSILFVVLLTCIIQESSGFPVPRSSRKLPQKQENAPVDSTISRNKPPLSVKNKIDSPIKPDRVWEPSDDLSLSLELSNITDLFSYFGKLQSSRDEVSQSDTTATTSNFISEASMPAIMAALCWGVALLSALDRVAMSVAVLPMSHELALTETTKGQISSLLSVGYGLAILPCGLLVACLSPRLLLGAGLGLWSVATMLTPVAAQLSMVFLLASRTAVGMAESAVLPAVQRLVSSWVPKERKSLAMAGIFSGFQAGTITAYLLSPLVMENLGGWRGLFYVYGGIGLVWLVPWLALSRDAPGDLEAQVKKDRQDDGVMNVKASISENRSLQGSFRDAVDFLKSAPWRSFATSPGVYAMTLAHAANNWGLYNNLAWTPTFYAEQYGLSVKDSALSSVLPSVAGAVGGLIAGSTADSIIQSMDIFDENKLTAVRKIYQGIALFGPALCLGSLAWQIPDHPRMAQAILTCTVGLQSFNSAGYAAANQEKAGEKWAGLLYSITSLPGVMIGSFAVALTGKVLDATQQDWSIVFGLNAFINVLGATAFVMLYNSKREFD